MPTDFFALDHGPLFAALQTRDYGRAHAFMEEHYTPDFHGNTTIQYLLEIPTVQWDAIREAGGQKSTARHLPRQGDSPVLPGQPGVLFRADAVVMGNGKDDFSIFSETLTAENDSSSIFSAPAFPRTDKYIQARQVGFSRDEPVPARVSASAPASRRGSSPHNDGIDLPAGAPRSPGSPGGRGGSSGRLSDSEGTEWHRHLERTVSADTEDALAVFL